MVGPDGERTLDGRGRVVRTGGRCLRRLAHQGDLTDDAATAAMEGFVRLGLTRFLADWLRGRMWPLRHNLSAYDATYVALTEMLSATSLLTADARLAAVAGVQCVVDVV